MRKFVGLAIAIIALLSFATVAEGAVAVKDNYADQERYVGEVTTLIIEGQDVSSDGSQVTILANGHKDGVTQNVSGETNLTSAALAYGVVQFADLGSMDGDNARYITLADGTPGQMITFTVLADSGGTLYITDDKVATAIKKTGWDDLAFDSALDAITLLYVDDTYGWIIIGSNSVTVT